MTMRQCHPKVGVILDNTTPELVVADCPTRHWMKIGSMNLSERINNRIERRTHVVGASPTLDSAPPLRHRQARAPPIGCRRTLYVPPRACFSSQPMKHD